MESPEFLIHPCLLGFSSHNLGVNAVVELHFQRYIAYKYGAKARPGSTALHPESPAHKQTDEVAASSAFARRPMWQMFS
jgi:hypothetical protein